MVSNFSNIITAHLQGLWISAYFLGRLAKDPTAAVGDEVSMSKLRYETVLHNRFGKWRYPIDWGNRNPSFIFDAVPYLDLLQRDLGLEPHRKAASGPRFGIRMDLRITGESMKIGRPSTAVTSRSTKVYSPLP
ncbi:hypothetical protein LRP88_12650 [Fusarium phalaenopsidis]